MIYKEFVLAIIALVAVGLLFGIALMYNNQSFTAGLCKIQKNVLRYVPLPGFAEQPLSEKCGDKKTVQRQRVKEMTNSVLADFILTCWENAEEGMYGQKLECFELYAVKVTGIIDEESVTDVIRTLNKCSTLPNNWLDVKKIAYPGICGTENKVLWKIAEPITSDTTIILRYNPLAHWVEVI